MKLSTAPELRRPRLVTGGFAASLSVALGIFIAHAIYAQSPAVQKFEVASIRLSACNNSGPVSSLIQATGRAATSPGRFIRECAHLRDLIQQAYGRSRFNLMRDQVLGGPGWLDTDFYDIIAKADANAPMDPMTGPMMQALLEDRFKLSIHRDEKDVPVYELTVGKGGHKLQVAKEGSCIPIDRDHPPPPLAPGQPLARSCGARFETGHGFDMYGTTIANFCEVLAFRMDRDVIDKTGIKGTFDIHLDVSRDGSAPGTGVSAGGATAVDSEPSSGDPRTMMAGFLRDMQQASEGVLAPAIQQQLGLKIEPGRGPGETIVIDHIERLSEN